MAERTDIGFHEALTKAYALGLSCVTEDGWMTPTNDDLDDDYSEYENNEIDGWKQTCHYEHYYARQFLDMRDELCEANDVHDSEERLHAFYIPIEEEFWRGWVEGHKLYEFWQAERAKLT